MIIENLHPFATLSIRTDRWATARKPRRSLSYVWSFPHFKFENTAFPCQGRGRLITLSSVNSQTTYRSFRFRSSGPPAFDTGTQIWSILCSSEVSKTNFYILIRENGTMEIFCRENIFPTFTTAMTEKLINVQPFYLSSHGDRTRVFHPNQPNGRLKNGRLQAADMNYIRV